MVNPNLHYPIRRQNRIPHNPLLNLNIVIPPFLIHPLHSIYKKQQIKSDKAGAKNRDKKNPLFHNALYPYLNNIHNPLAVEFAKTTFHYHNPNLPIIFQLASKLYKRCCFKYAKI